MFCKNNSRMRQLSIHARLAAQITSSVTCGDTFPSEGKAWNVLRLPLEGKLDAKQTDEVKNELTALP